MTYLLIVVVVLIAAIPAISLWVLFRRQKKAREANTPRPLYKLVPDSALNCPPKSRRIVTTVTRPMPQRRAQEHLDGNPIYATLPTSYGYGSDPAPAAPHHSESHFSGGGGDFGGGGASASYDSCSSSDSGGGCDGGGGGGD